MTMRFFIGEASATGPGFLTASGVQPLGGAKQLNAPASATVASLEFNNGTRNWINFGTNGLGTPAFTTRTTGVKILLYPQIDGSNVDYAWGMEATPAMWWSVPRATTGFQYRWYAGTTVIASLRGDGLLDNTGTIRATGGTAPSSGAGLEVNYTGGVGQLAAYDRTGAAYKNLNLDGLAVALRPSGAATFTASATNNSNTVPNVLMSCTLATVPSASANARGLVYITDLSGGAEPCFSDGTNWRVCSTRAIAA